MPFVATDTILDRILQSTADSLPALKDSRPLADLRREAEAADPPRNFIAALRREMVALIAEVKHASPSKGLLIEDFNPARLAKIYDANGAAAISVLTDAPFFRGSLDDLRAVRAAVDLPILRKDFIIDPYQVYQAREAGADAILLIVAALENGQLADLKAAAESLGMAALIEVHNEAELERALKASPGLLGVNNRDLKTFDVDLETTSRLIRQVPGEVTFVAESGIGTPADVHQVGELGAHAVLVGEGLVTAPDIGKQVRALSRVSRKRRRHDSR